jgi:flagellar basal body-associated protein FliL
MFKWTVALAIIVGAPAAASMALATHPDTSPTAEPHFVEFPEIVVPIIDSGRLNGRLRMTVVLAATDAHAAARLAKTTPLLRSTVIASGIEFSRLQVSGLMPVDAKALADELNRSLRHVDQGVGRVLIVNVAAEMA